MFVNYTENCVNKSSSNYSRESEGEGEAERGEGKEKRGTQTQIEIHGTNGVFIPKPATETRFLSFSPPNSLSLSRLTISGHTYSLPPP